MTCCQCNMLLLCPLACVTELVPMHAHPSKVTEQALDCAQLLPGDQRHPAGGGALCVQHALAVAARAGMSWARQARACGTRLDICLHELGAAGACAWRASAQSLHATRLEISDERGQRVWHELGAALARVFGARLLSPCMHCAWGPAMCTGSASGMSWALHWRVCLAGVCSLPGCTALGNQRCARAARVRWGPACAASYRYSIHITVYMTRRGF